MGLDTTASSVKKRKKIRVGFCLRPETDEMLTRVSRTTKLSKSALIDDILSDALKAYEVLFDSKNSMNITESLKYLADKIKGLENEHNQRAGE